AADAGAYTFANTVARDMNFMAYTNRAMVANHAVIGQLVSLASLSQMIYLAADDLEELQNLRGVPYVGPIFAAIGEAFEAVKEAIEGYVLPFLKYLAEGQNVLIKGISYMQAGMHYLSAADIAKVGEVVKANDPELKWDVSSGGGWLSTAANVKAFLGDFTERRSDDAAYDRIREVVNLSRDGFTVRREWLPTPGGPILSDVAFHGGTQLSSDNKTWMGVDGFEVEVEMPWPMKNLWFRFWLTGEFAGDSDVDDWRKLSHGDLSKKGHKKAHNNLKDQMEDTYDGLQPYYELSGDPKPGERPSDPFVVLVYKPVQNATTPNATQTFGTEADNPFHLDEGRVRIYGVAASQVYFRRPAQSDKDPTAAGLPSALYKNGTYATLFSPYWQPRLTDVPGYVTAGLLMAADK
ncbi:MAG: hypothetical protein LBF93_10285, partial [Zoogloeaceae bacterium]|nr:hypothetical protein [Zoogloeaceae bacterium]